MLLLADAYTLGTGVTRSPTLVVTPVAMRSCRDAEALAIVPVCAKGGIMAPQLGSRP
jgi:hypothetical protein